MGRIIIFILAIAAIPWAISTWWQIRKARSERERSFIGRSRIGVAVLVVAGTVTFTMLTLRGQIAALPLAIACGFAVRHAMRRTRERIREEEGDPVARAKRVN